MTSQHLHRLLQQASQRLASTRQSMRAFSDWRDAANFNRNNNTNAFASNPIGYVSPRSQSTANVTGSSSSSLGNVYMEMSNGVGGHAQHQPQYQSDAQYQSSFGGKRFSNVDRSAPSPSTVSHETTPFPDELSQDYSSATLFSGASAKPFSADVATALQAPLEEVSVEIKPDGIIYLPECRYRRILSKAFGPGGWALVPRGAHSLVTSNGNCSLSREYALYCQGRFVSQARGHAAIMSFASPAMSSEVVRSNALMRLCKDLGVGSELFDPAYVAQWKAKHAVRFTDSNGRMRWRKKEASEH